jgi:cysteine desulfurase
MNKVYLDYNATAPMRPEVRDLVMEIMGDVGNASSVHHFGRTARKYVEDARAQVAKLCAVTPDQVVFTSGATESINTVLFGFRDKRVLISAIEHPAVLAAAAHAEKIPVTADGVVDMKAYEALLNDGEPPALVSVMLVNSETGVIQPVKEMAEKAHAVGALFHTDAVQGAGRLDISLETLGVDFISLSAHKFAGPQGVGAIIYREGLELPRFMLGGGQEKNCRAGTHNTAGIAGMGLAAEIALQQIPRSDALRQMRDHLESRVRQLSNQAVIYGENSPRVGNTMNVGLPGIPAQTQLMALDLDGIAVSSGSACSSGAFKASHVLTAMGTDEEAAKSALRISLGWATTQADIDRFFDSWSKLVERNKK